ncbi:MAG: acyltransferase family protein [Bacteroidales bacterium]|nr:acyltransferase family protein [Bacteroidales bacterium]
MSATKISQPRAYWIDAIRSTACLFVISTHVAMPGTPKSLAMDLYNHYTMAGASILFFMISGALVLYKPKPAIPFLKQRVSRVVLPMVLWTLVSLLIDKCTTSLTWDAFFTKVMLIPFSPQQGIYWFIYAIFGIYLLTPILATWLQHTTKRELQFYLGVWAFTLTIPYLTHIHKDLRGLIDYQNGAVYYFWGYLWAAVMGYYLRKYVNIKRFKRWHIVAIAAAIGVPLALHLCTSLPIRTLNHRLSLPTIALCCCYFVLLKHMPLKPWAEKMYYNFAQHSFGIYLVHIYIIRHALWPLFQQWALPTEAAIPLLIATAAILSYLAVRLLALLPKSKYLVGV